MAKQDTATIDAFERKRVQIFFDPDSGRTKPEFQKDCDLETIVSRFKRTGVIEHVRKHQGVYTDLTEAPDYMTALNKVIAADEAFMSLPAKIRQRFSHSPAEFLAFVDDPANRDEMVVLGLIPQVEIVSPTPPNEEVPVEPVKKAKKSS
jgi:phage internal scaffolding protein